MQIIAALMNLLSLRTDAPVAMPHAAEVAEHQVMLAELRSLFQDDLDDHDRSACTIALKSTSHRARP